MCHTVPVDTHLVRSSWTAGGGTDAQLPAHATRWLRGKIGLTEQSTPVAPDAVLAVPASALPESAREALEVVVGHEHVLSRRADRLGRAGGMSYVDLMVRRGQGAPSVPDAVVVPADPEEVRRVVEVCAEHGIGVVP